MQSKYSVTLNELYFFYKFFSHWLHDTAQNFTLFFQYNNPRYYIVIITLLM